MSAFDNSIPPYRHWHVVCSRCRSITLALPCCPPSPIPALEGPITVTCAGCNHAREYAVPECFLTPFSAITPPKTENGTVAVIAGMVAAVRLARVESVEINAGLPRVSMAIADAVHIARKVWVKVKQP